MDIKKQINAILNQKLTRQGFLKLLLLLVIATLLGFGTVAALILKIGKGNPAPKKTVEVTPGKITSTPTGSGQPSSKPSPSGKPSTGQPKSGTNTSTSHAGRTQSGGTTSGTQSSGGNQSGGAAASGMSWGIGNYDWFSDGNKPTLAPAQTYHNLYGWGVRRMRLPFSWEFMQPTLGGALSSTYINYMIQEISTAWAAGIGVIPCPINGAAYNGKYFGEAGGPTKAQFNNLWTRMSTAFNGHPGVIAYDIMNEPNTMPGNTRSEAIVWEQYSQSCVSAIRAIGDNTCIHVEGMAWSNVESWADLHPTAWISDPANNIIYSAHDYPDENGIYNLSTGGNGYQDKYTTTAAWFEANYTGGVNFDTWNLNRLKVFTDWLKANNARGDIGETGYPSSFSLMTWQGLSASAAASEAAKWNNLLEQYLTACKNANLSLTWWFMSGWVGANWGEGYGTIMFRNSAFTGNTVTDMGDHNIAGVIDTTCSQYQAFQNAGLT